MLRCKSGEPVAFTSSVVRYSSFTEVTGNKETVFWLWSLSCMEILLSTTFVAFKWKSDLSLCLCVYFFRYCLFCLPKSLKTQALRLPHLPTSFPWMNSIPCYLQGRYSSTAAEGLAFCASAEMLFVQIYLLQMCDQRATSLIIRTAKFHYEHIMGLLGQEASWEDSQFTLQPFSCTALPSSLQHWTQHPRMSHPCIGWT